MHLRRKHANTLSVRNERLHTSTYWLSRVILANRVQLIFFDVKSTYWYKCFFIITEKSAQQPVFIKEEKEDPEYSDNVNLPEEEQSDEPPPKRLARSASPPHANGVISRTPSPRYHVHDSCRPRADHMTKENERPSLQLPWRSTFRDQDDFDYTVKLLQKSLGESALKRRKPPSPVEVLSKVFPSHKENVLELVLKGCSGDIVQAIECILAGKSHSMEFPVASASSCLSSIPLSSSYPSMPFAGVKPSLLSSMPPALPLTSLNGVTKTTTHPLSTMGVLSVQAHGGMCLAPHIRSLPVHSHRGGEHEAGEVTGFSKPSGLLRTGFLSPYSRSPHSPGESSFSENEVSACFRCGTKPRSGDRFCGKCGADLKC